MNGLSGLSGMNGLSVLNGLNGVRGLRNLIGFNQSENLLLVSESVSEEQPEALEMLAHLNSFAPPSQIRCLYYSTIKTTVHSALYGPREQTTKLHREAERQF